MLSRMQEASQYTTRLKKKEKEKIVSIADEVGIGSSSDRFQNQNYQNPRFYNDRDCYGELRKFIRESLGRQNVLPNESVNARAYFDRKGTGFSTDLPSTNSSRSTTTYSHDSASSVSSSSSNIPEDRLKASNLIAKLMGLEEISSTTLQSESRKQLERDKNLNPKGLIFEIDMSKRKKPWLDAQNGDRECMTLEQIIQNMQFKGLLNKDQFQVYHSLTSESENRFGNHAPPVVLMKPVQLGVGANDLFSHKFIPREGHVDFDKRQSMSKTKEEITSRILEHSDEVMLHSYLNKAPIKKKTKASIAKPSRKALQKPADKEVKIKEYLSGNKVKLTDSVSSRLHKDVTDKKVDKVQKTTSGRTTVEKDHVKSTGLLKHHEQAKSVSRSQEQQSPPAMKLRKCITGPSIDNKNLTKRKSIKSKLMNEALAINVESTVCKDDDTHIDQRKESALNMKDTTPGEQLLADEELDDSNILIKDIYVDSPNPHCKDTLLTTQHEYDTSCREEATKSTNHHLTESTPYQTRSTSSNILSRSLSFLTRVEDLFDNIDTYQPIVLQILTGLHGYDGTNSKLLMDCANELLESRSQRNIPHIYPLIQRPLENLSFCISMDNLMQEVHNRIESLTSYRNRIPTNVVSALLEKDLWCKGRNAEAWDMGWRDEFTGDEVQKIACDLEKLIIGELVVEVLADFCS